MIKEIESTKQKLRKGQAGKFYQPIAEHVDELEPLAIATIIMKVTFDMVFSTKRDYDHAVNIINGIGAALENECKFRWYHSEHPGLMKYIEDKYFHESCGTEQKVSIASQMFGKRDIRWPNWGQKTKISIGTWGLRCVIEATGWFTKHTIRVKYKTFVKIVPTEAFNAIRDQLIKTAELFSGMPWPMLVEPNDWTNERLGGYLINE